jgi:hypothetical protein
MITYKVSCTRKRKRVNAYTVIIGLYHDMHYTAIQSFYVDGNRPSAYMHGVRLFVGTELSREIHYEIERRA